MFLCVGVCVHTCVYMCMCVQMRVCMYVWNVCKHMYNGILTSDYNTYISLIPRP